MSLADFLGPKISRTPAEKGQTAVLDATSKHDAGREMHESQIEETEILVRSLKHPLHLPAPDLANPKQILLCLLPGC